MLNYKTDCLGGDDVEQPSRPRFDGLSVYLAFQFGFLLGIAASRFFGL